MAAVDLACFLSRRGGVFVGFGSFKNGSAL